MLKEIQINDIRYDVINGFIDIKTAPFLDNNIRILDYLAELSVLKNDKKITVGLIDKKNTGYPYSLLIKTFKYKSSAKYYLRKYLSNKAEKLFKNHKLLIDSNLKAPLPFAFINIPKNNESVFISQYIEDSFDFANYCKKEQVLDHNNNVLNNIINDLIKMHINGIYHGDLKWVNILINDNNEVFFIDLDQIKKHNYPYVKGIYKDLVRFHRFALETNNEYLSKNIFLPKYYALFPDEIKTKIDICKIMEIAFQQWQIKDYRKIVI